jgi:hypothetical protein
MAYSHEGEPWSEALLLVPFQLFEPNFELEREFGSAFSLLKRGIVGTWHKISAKHLPAYLEEMVRFNRRKRSDLFVDTLRHMVTAPTLTFEKLTA